VDTEAHLRAGVAVFDAGHYHAAHDAFEDRWLDLKTDLDPRPSPTRTAAEAENADLPLDLVVDPENPTDRADERLFHGLIQFTAAVHHAVDGNTEGAEGLARSARTYLRPLPEAYRKVNLAEVRRILVDLAADPTDPPVAPLTHDGRVLTFEDLDFPATAVAASVLAEAFGYDVAVVDHAVGYARTDLDAGNDGSRFLTLVFDFVRDDANRGIVFDRLRGHTERRRTREEDVDGLFE
jgi:predicted metal-dependent hydrolase